MVLVEKGPHVLVRHSATVAPKIRFVGLERTTVQRERAVKMILESASMTTALSARLQALLFRLSPQ